jgi:hypothetical protein
MVGRASSAPDGNFSWTQTWFRTSDSVFILPHLFGSQTNSPLVLEEVDLSQKEILDREIVCELECGQTIGA